MWVYTMTRQFTVTNQDRLHAWRFAAERETCPQEVADLIWQRARLLMAAHSCGCYAPDEYNAWLFTVARRRKRICTFHAVKQRNSIYHAAVGTARELAEVNRLLHAPYFALPDEPDQPDWDLYREHEPNPVHLRAYVA